MQNAPRPKPQLAPLTTVEMAEFAATQIREAIIDGAYQPGDRLIENDVAEQLQVSRHPVREALRRLAREGFVEVRANRGAVVTDISAASILEVYEIRAALGALALRHLLLGRKGPSDANIRKLEQLAEKAHYYAGEDNQKQMVKYDLLFQATIIEASGLGRMAAYFHELNAEIQQFNNIFKMSYSDKQPTIKRHLFGLLKAIRSGNLNAAEQIWHDKFVTAATRFMAHVPDLGEYQSRDPSWLLFAAGPATSIDVKSSSSPKPGTRTDRGGRNAKLSEARRRRNSAA